MHSLYHFCVPVSSSDDGCLLYEHFEQLPAKNVIEIVNTSVCFNFESASIEASVRFFSVRRIDKMRMFLENSRYDPWTATMSSESLRSLLLFCKLGLIILMVLAYELNLSGK